MSASPEPTRWHERLKGALDPFLFALLGALVLAALAPPRGRFVEIVDGVADAGIVALFFLHGAKLSREAILEGMTNWKLHVAVLSMTYVLFPLLGLGLARLPAMPPSVAAGVLFLSLLPSTVQSSIAFTSIAGGNVVGAVCSASLSNLLGVFLTPLLVALLMDTDATVSLGSVQTLFTQLLLPFVAGHFSRPFTGAFVTRHKAVLGKIDRGSILIVVYAAFGAAVVDGLLETLRWVDLAWILGASAAMLAVVLGATWSLAHQLGMPRQDAIVLLFAGSKKSLASGVPMASVLFPAATVGAILLPLMVFHQVQLVVCAILARRLARDVPEPTDDGGY